MSEHYTMGFSDGYNQAIEEFLEDLENRDASRAFIRLKWEEKIKK